MLRLWIYIISYCLAIVFLYLLYAFVKENVSSIMPDQLHLVQIKDTIYSSKYKISQSQCLFKSQAFLYEEGQRVFKTEYSICDSLYQSELSYRSNLHNAQSITEVHRALLKNGDELVTQISAAFNEHRKTRSIKDFQFAQLVVASIQQIPYTLVHSESHNNCNLELCKITHEKLRKSHRFSKWDFVGGCAEKVEPLGVFSPIEVAYHHMADCDSRTLFLFKLMKKIGFDVVILGSDIEGHSILGINLAGMEVLNGASTFQDRVTNKKYVVWETTTEVGPGIYFDWVPSRWTIDIR